MSDYQDDEVIEIRGEPKYYSTGQVAKVLGEADSTIRYWSDEFDDFLKIKKTGPSGRVRRFTKTDIEKIQYIRSLLKDENLSINQVKDFLSSPDANELRPIQKEREQIMMEALANVISAQVDKVFEEKFDELEELLLESAKIQANAQKKFKENVIKEIEDKNTAIQKEIKEQYAKIEEKLSETEAHWAQKANEREEKLDKYIEEMRSKNAEEEKSSFWSRLFKKR